MNVRIAMSLELYDRFWKQCAATSREYAILKNGLIVRHPEEGQPDRVMKFRATRKKLKIFSPSPPTFVLENSLKMGEITAQTEPSKAVPLPPSSWQWS